MTNNFHLLAIYAHPDDEAFGASGTFATVTDRGGTVTLVCATRGEAGEISDPAFATAENLGEVREQELRDAMALLNVSDVRLLGFRDSGMAGTAGNGREDAFVNADPADVVSRLVDIMREVPPHVVLTFGPDGVYGHPDHLKIHAAATSALEIYAPATEVKPALYYNAVPKSRIREMAKRPNGPFKNVSADELGSYGTPDELITTQIDVSHQFERKLAAILAHRTQIAAGGPWSGPEHDVRELTRVERFRLAMPSESESGVDPLFEFCQPPVT